MTTATRKPKTRPSQAPKPDRVFRALADATRLRILHLLLRGELCVCDLVAVLGCPQPTASRHLAYLRKAGLVVVRKAGVWCFYQLAPAASLFDAAWRECVEECRVLPRFARDAERLAAVRSGCCSEEDSAASRRSPARLDTRPSASAQQR